MAISKNEEGLVVAVIGDVSYPLVKTGRAQARQVTSFTTWLSKYGAQALQGLQASNDADSGMGILLRFIQSLDEDALIDLFEVVIGCPKEASELHFDAADLIEACVALYSDSPTIKRLVDRFFSDTN
jgi:hypothetical protein